MLISAIQNSEYALARQLFAMTEANQPDFATKKFLLSDLADDFRLRDFLFNQPEVQHATLFSSTAAVAEKPYISRELFISFIMDGNRVVVEQLLRHSPDCVAALTEKHEALTDSAGRIFYNLSPFQYILWRLDCEMWGVVLDEVLQKAEDKNPRLTVVTRKILTEQYEELLERGVCYTENHDQMTRCHRRVRRTGGLAELGNRLNPPRDETPHL